MAKAKPWKTTAIVWDRKAQAAIPVKVEIAIDWQGIADRMASRAYRNKSGRSGDLGGLIKAKIVKPS